jgi:hypothetical protein
VFEDRVLRRIFRNTRGERTGYSVPNIIRVFKLRKIRWVRNVTHMGEVRNSYRILVSKPEMRPWHRW